MNQTIQLILIIAVPLVGIVTNVALFIHVSSRVDTLREHFDTKMDLLMSKMVDIDNRVTRIEAQR